MEGNTENNQFPNNDQGSNLDLTLRLGTSVNDTKNLEENSDVDNNSFPEENNNVDNNSFHGFPGIGDYANNNEGNFSMHGLGGSSSTYGDSRAHVGAPLMPLTATMYAPNAYNLAFYQGLMPSYPTTPPQKMHHKKDESKTCQICGVNSTPLWRKGPDGPQTLCNACGLKHLRTVKKD